MPFHQISHEKQNLVFFFFRVWSTQWQGISIIENGIHLILKGSLKQLAGMILQGRARNRPFLHLYTFTL